MVYFIGTHANITNIEKCSFEFMLDYFKDINTIQVDTETQGFFDFKNRVLTIQLGDSFNQFVIEFSSLSSDDKIKLNENIFINRRKKKVFQNAKFDIKFLWLEGFDIINVYDTMLAEQIIYAGKETEQGFFSLGELCKRYCDVTLDKSIRGEIHRFGICEPVVEYAAKDVKYLEDIRNKQLEKLKELKLYDGIDDQNELTILGLENKVVVVFASMEYNGILIDVAKWREVELLLEKKILDIEEELNSFIWKEPLFKKYQLHYQDLFTEAKKITSINWSSPAQKLELLNLLDPEIDDTSERILSKYKKYPIVCKLLEYSKTNKLYTAFAKKMYSHINPITNRIHTDFFQILSTGRVSSNKPNLQQIPSRSEIGGLMRSCFIPKKGYKMVGGDFSGCELRVIAEFSKDPIWVNAFLEGKDLHSELCAATFDISVKDVKTPTPFKPDIKYRDVQKTLNFGLAYGMSKFKLADTIEISVEQADAIINKFFGAVPAVKKFLDTIGNFGKRNGYIRTPPPYGRIRWFEGFESGDFKRLGEIERASKNSPIQGANADLTKLALIRVYEHIKENNLPINIVLTIHDEIQTEVREDFAEEWAKIMGDLMQASGAEILKTIPMLVDCNIANYWSK